MTAPSLVLLTTSSGDARCTETAHQLRASVLELRPDLDVHVAFLDHQPPTALQVVRALARSAAPGIAAPPELVFVPLLLSDAFEAAEMVPLLGQIRNAHPGLAVAAARPVGPDASLLKVLDRNLREALRAQRVVELDGLVFACAGSPDVRSNALVARRARQWATHHRLPCVTAFGAQHGPSTAAAVRTLRSQGRRHVAVASWFAGPGTAYLRSLQQAHDAGAVAVSAPLGAEPEMATAVLTRYLVAAMELVDLEPLVAAAGASSARHLRVVPA